MSSGEKILGVLTTISPIGTADLTHHLRSFSSEQHPTTPWALTTRATDTRISAQPIPELVRWSIVTANSTNLVWQTLSVRSSLLCSFKLLQRCPSTTANGTAYLNDHVTSFQTKVFLLGYFSLASGAVHRVSVPPCLQYKDKLERDAKKVLI